MKRKQHALDVGQRSWRKKSTQRAHELHDLLTAYGVEKLDVMDGRLFLFGTGYLSNAHGELMLQRCEAAANIQHDHDANALAQAWRELDP